MKTVNVRHLSTVDRTWADYILVRNWGSTEMVTRGRIHDVSSLPGMIAWHDKMGKRVGLATYRIHESDCACGCVSSSLSECEITSLDSLHEGYGIGTKLIDAVKEKARASGCSRLWLITTNDNEKAIDFYKNRGFSIAAIHENAIDEISRKLKPEIAKKGHNGVEVKDEVELEIDLIKLDGSPRNRVGNF